ncbi:MAG: GldG family protein [Puniceicoccales bacterium]|nr:GldG family protein [Puniceicoccales bacterium]
MPFSEDFRWARKIKLLNKILGIVVILLVVAAINIFSVHHFIRFDWQKKRNFALEEFSLNVLNILEDPVEIYLFYGRSQDDAIPFFVNDLRNLLKEYRHAASKRIRVKFIDTVQQQRMAEELSLRFGAVTSNSIVISSREHFRIIPAFELYEFKDGIVSGFRGEQIISDEILKLSNRETKKVLFSTGHGEMDIDSVHPLYGSSSVKELLRQNGYRVEKVKLTEKIDDGSVRLLIIAGAQTNFAEKEIQVLRNFLNRDGRVLILLSPPRVCGLEDLFFDWGILADDMLIISNDDHLGISGDNMIDNFAEHPITQPMITMQLVALFGLCQPVRLDIGAPVRQYKAISLLSSGEKTFAKLDYLQRKPQYNPSEDLAGPVSVAVLSEHMIDEKTAGMQGKLLVIGSADFINNNRFCVLGNKILFHSVVTWLLEGTDSLSNSVKVRPTENYKITLSQAELFKIGIILLLIPFLVLLLGYLVAYIRRNMR